MSFTRVLMCIDDFKITADGSSQFSEVGVQDEIHLHGWFLAGAPITRMEVVFPARDGDEQIVIAVPDCNRPSEDIYAKFNGEFGELARRSRFYFAERLNAHHIDPAKGVLRIRTADNTVLERGLGEPKQDLVRAPYSEDERALVSRFESIGENCELGLVQRRVGVEQLTLLRFAGIHDPLTLASAIRRRFEGFAEGVDGLRCLVKDGEWMVRANRPLIDLHTGRLIGAVSEEEILRSERPRLRFLADRFIDDLEDSQRIYIYRTIRPDGSENAESGVSSGMDELYDSLCSVGRRPILIWLTEANSDHEANSIRHVRDHLFRGWIAQLTPLLNATTFDTRMWLNFLEQSLKMVEQTIRLREASGVIAGSLETTIGLPPD